MEPNTYLFLGGCADGQRIRVPANRHRVECHPDQFKRPSHAPREPGQPFSRLAHADPEFYESMDFHGGADERFTVFVRSGMTPATALNLLIKHYRPSSDDAADVSRTYRKQAAKG